jgi:hypothetical protein
MKNETGQNHTSPPLATEKKMTALILSEGLDNG